MTLNSFKNLWDYALFALLEAVKLPLNENRILNLDLFIALFAEKRSEWRKIY
jgi:hypothetical protein